MSPQVLNVVESTQSFVPLAGSSQDSCAPHKGSFILFVFSKATQQWLPCSWEARGFPAPPAFSSSEQPQHLPTAVPWLGWWSTTRMGCINILNKGCKTEVKWRQWVKLYLQEWERDNFCLPDCPSLHCWRDCQGLVYVVCKYSSYQAKIRIVGSLYNFIHGFKSQYFLNGPKNLQQRLIINKPAPSEAFNSCFILLFKLSSLS